MSWAYNFDERALSELSKLDRQAQAKIIRYLDERIATEKIPNVLAKV